MKISYLKPFEIPWMYLYRTPERETLFRIFLLKSLLWFCAASLCLYLWTYMKIGSHFFSLALYSAVLIKTTILLIFEKFCFSWIPKKRRNILSEKEKIHREIFQKYKDSIVCAKRSYDVAMEHDEIKEAKKFLSLFDLKVINELEIRYDVEIK